jgi:hypothetical protein
MPVYKEGLGGYVLWLRLMMHKLTADLLRFIIPTVTILQSAIKYYEKGSSTVLIFVNEDGMQTVSADLAE